MSLACLPFGMLVSSRQLPYHFLGGPRHTSGSHDTESLTLVLWTDTLYFPFISQPLEHSPPSTLQTDDLPQPPHLPWLPACLCRLCGPSRLHPFHRGLRRPCPISLHCLQVGAGFPFPWPGARLGTPEGLRVGRIPLHLQDSTTNRKECVRFDSLYASDVLQEYV